MTPLRQHMMAALPRSGKGERTQQASGREVRLLAPCSGTSPALLSQQELQHSCLHRTHVAGLAPAAMRLCSSGSRCFSPHILQRDWHTLTLMREPTAHRLPAVLSVAEVRRLLKAAPPRHTPSSCPPSRAWACGSTRPSPRRRARGLGALRTATSRAGMTTTGVAVPPLWHASATHLLAAGVNRRLIPPSLGHTY